MVNYVAGINLWFHAETSKAIRDALESAYAQNRRIRVWYGDVLTGRAWAEENDVLGKLGRSTGRIKVPLIVEDGEDGGSAMLDHCIVRIDVVIRQQLQPGQVRADGKTARSIEVGTTLYQHPSFHTGNWEVSASDLKGYAEVACLDGDVHARFKRAGQAAKYIKFMQGDTFRMN